MIVYTTEFRKKVFNAVLPFFGEISDSERGKQARMALDLGLSDACISKYKKYGVPSNRIEYFRLRFPQLDVWNERQQAMTRV